MAFSPLTLASHVLPQLLPSSWKGAELVEWEGGGTEPPSQSALGGSTGSLSTATTDPPHAQQQQAQGAGQQQGQGDAHGPWRLTKEWLQAMWTWLLAHPNADEQVWRMLVGRPVDEVQVLTYV